jgi:Mannosylglycerate hydrolase MGH1-like glycoside hydrolase domain/Glycosyl hydrolase family 63 C-terminal domain
MIMAMVTDGARGAEERRLEEARTGTPWKRWGPYLSERQWGTVREDYSDNGDAWSYFSHDQARSRAYKWGEDGIGGLCDDRQQLCFAVALWNGVDPILKERLFGVTNAEGNHGEDVKEYYFYLDATPSSSYLAYRYRYPLGAYPYADLIATNRSRSRTEMEYELVDTGVFDDDRYVDLDIEYAKAGPEDVHIRLTLRNRSADVATVQLLPSLWFRNTWWLGGPKGQLRGAESAGGAVTVAVDHPFVGDRVLRCEGQPVLLFTENETNEERLWGTANSSPYVKDAFHECVVHGRADAVNPARTGTKAAAQYVLDIPGGGTAAVHLQLCPTDAPALDPAAADALVETRRAEADAFYAWITPDHTSADEASVMRQALAGMLWGKQHYFFDLDKWLEEHHAHPLRGREGDGQVRNRNWFHMVNDDVISMPDTWEYPWYATWDLAFHTVALAMLDVDDAKAQLGVMLRELYMHPSGQLPAYEWDFGDVNPPVHAWATLLVYETELEQRGAGDVAWLRSAFQKLLVNFTWWINRKDPTGRNVFEGGFLGLDNIGVFDRSAPLPTGGHLDQSDGTSWMAFYSQCMLSIALELSQHDPVYEDMVMKFAEHFAFIAAAMDRIGDNHDELWDEEDGFFYDVLRLPNGDAQRLKVRSMVGLLPLCATTMLPLEDSSVSDDLQARLRRRIESMPELFATIHDARVPGYHGRRMLATVDENKLRRILARMLDEDEFLSPHGLRALSRYHLDHPYVFDVHGQRFEVGYLPAESDSGMFGGNSNWRGPVWFPVNFLILRGLLHLYAYYGDDFTVECPTGSGNQCTLYEVAAELGRRLVSIFVPGPDGRRPVYGGTERFQTDPNWKEHVLFYEYFHGDNGAGLGASHQTGWTGLVARIIQVLGYLQPADLLRPEVRGNLVYATVRREAPVGGQ